MGNPDFFAFGEVFDANPAYTSTFTTTGRLDATLDFGFQGSGTNFAKGTATTGLRDFYASDDYYTDTDSNAYSLPTFLGNHDMGRIGMFLDAESDGAELLSRDKLAHALMYLGRGQPVVYYGDEQGFTGDGGDQLARQDMFPSRVAVVQRRRPDRHRCDHRRRQLRHRASRCTGPSGPWRGCAGSTPLLATEHSCIATPATKPGVYAFSRIST